MPQTICKNRVHIEHPRGKNALVHRERAISTSTTNATIVPNKLKPSIGPPLTNYTSQQCAMRRTRSGHPRSEHAVPGGTGGTAEGSLSSFGRHRKMLRSLVSWSIHRRTGCPPRAGKTWRSSEIPRLIHAGSQGPLRASVLVPEYRRLFGAF